MASTFALLLFEVQTRSSFAKLWTETGGEEEIIDRVIKRWRSQGK